jgi:hypothetical protein
MQLIPVQCSHCGASVQVDSYSKSFICSICGGTTMIEKNSHDSYHDERIQKAELLIDNQDNYKEAKSTFQYMTTSYPDDPRPWLGLIRCYTHDLEYKLYLDVSPYEPIWLSGLEARLMDAYNNYIRVETKEREKANTTNIFMNYIEQNKKEYEELKEKNKDTDPTTPPVGTSDFNFTETIKAENKIIDSNDILEVIKKMEETLKKYKFIYKKEEEYNKTVDYEEAEYTFKDYDSELKFSVNFHDNTDVRTNNIEEFYYVYENRLAEIKDFSVCFALNYSLVQHYPEKKNDSFYQTIWLYVYENKLSIDVKMDVNDDKLSGLYSDIKKIILSAPVKYDKIIKNKMGISLVCAFGIGLIPALLLTTILNFTNEQLNIMFATSYVLYPLLTIIIGLVIGEGISFVLLGKLYENIKPDKKYAGYNDNGSIYKDDVEDYVNKSEVLIGKNVNNMKDREAIKNLYNKCKKLMLINFGILAIMSIIIVVIYTMAE